jgi:hypothetical protein
MNGRTRDGIENTVMVVLAPPTPITSATCMCHSAPFLFDSRSEHYQPDYKLNRIVQYVEVKAIPSMEAIKVRRVPTSGDLSSPGDFTFIQKREPRDEGLPEEEGSEEEESQEESSEDEE